MISCSLERRVKSEEKQIIKKALKAKKAEIKSLFFWRSIRDALKTGGRQVKGMVLPGIALEKEIDELVYQLCGLTEGEIALVEGKK
ncbi:MAG TPA: hypothetical protein VLH56_14525 [Dissulfurispiraceae bacterium]|nr:hypothetical protein [Dissulfurispiraceae bacterium]